MPADHETSYAVLRNGEGQYSISDERLEVPPGWVSVGVVGPGEECARYIDEVWSDLRPLSLIPARGVSSG